jgi:hypothetical protein
LTRFHSIIPSSLPKNRREKKKEEESREGTFALYDGMMEWKRVIPYN